MEKFNQRFEADCNIWIFFLCISFFVDEYNDIATWGIREDERNFMKAVIDVTKFWEWI